MNDGEVKLRRKGREGSSLWCGGGELEGVLARGHSA